MGESVVGSREEETGQVSSCQNAHGIQTPSEGLAFDIGAVPPPPKLIFFQTPVAVWSILYDAVCWSCLILLSPLLAHKLYENRVGVVLRTGAYKSLGHLVKIEFCSSRSGWNPRSCISNRLPGNADTDGLGTTLCSKVLCIFCCTHH